MNNYFFRDKNFIYKFNFFVGKENKRNNVIYSIVIFVSKAITKNKKWKDIQSFRFFCYKKIFFDSRYLFNVFTNTKKFTGRKKINYIFISLYMF